jgi:His/Glu/Gln/Arg/opine family amino acid ABC transporter permease subunit
MPDLNFAPVIASLGQLLRAAGASVVIGLVGMLLAMTIGTLGTAVSALGPIWKRVVHLYVDLFRGTPLLVQILVFFFIPAALDIDLSPYVAGTLALALYYGAYITEIVRGAFEGVPVGHVQAARSLGMRPTRIFLKIQFPQALAVVVSPLAGQFTRLFKATSLLSVIGVMELTLRGQFVMQRTYAPIETWLVIALIYLCFNALVLYAAALLEQRLVRGRA